MIGRIKGMLVDKQPPYLVVEACGVGYEVEAPMSVFYALPEVGQEVLLYTHFVVREDAQLLYGFSSRDERELFRTLIKVNGVGPKLGLTLLSGIEASQFVRCVHEADSSTLVKLPGVGKKTAERLIVEMKDKLDRWLSSPLFEGQLMVVGDEMASQAKDIEQEAVSALVALGYKPKDASKIVSKQFRDGISSEELIRRALQNMI